MVDVFHCTQDVYPRHGKCTQDMVNAPKTCTQDMVISWVHLIDVLGNTMSWGTSTMSWVHLRLPMQAIVIKSRISRILTFLAYQINGCAWRFFLWLCSDICCIKFGQSLVAPPCKCVAHLLLLLIQVHFSNRRNACIISRLYVCVCKINSIAKYFEHA